MPGGSGRGVRVLVRLGAALLGVGGLLLAFVAYQLWGTALVTDRAQSRLRSQLATELHDRSLPVPGAPAAGGAASAAGGAGATGPAAHAGLPPLAGSPAPPTPAPAVGDPVGLLAIPRIGLDDAIVEGTDAPQLRGGPGHYLGTALPGQPGNAAIAGHRTTYAAPFYHLDALEPGDPIYVLTGQGLFRYDVTRTEVVAPTDVAVLDPTATPTLTLTTCNPRYSAATRLVVVATMHTTVPAPPAASPPPAPAAAAGSLAGDGLAGVAGALWGALAWGAGFALGALFLILASRRARRWRWPVRVVGLPVLAAVLLECFAHLSAALPASF